MISTNSVHMRLISKSNLFHGDVGCGVGGGQGAERGGEKEGRKRGITMQRAGLPRVDCSRDL